MLTTLLSNQGPPPNTPWIKVSGTWRQATMFIKVGGVWEITNPKVKVSGTWR